MKIAIPFLYWTAKAALEIEIPDDTPERWRMRAAVEIAVKSGASLDRASLDRASLDRASLDRANLDGASLNLASLNGASLNGASLNLASLNGANLDGASLNLASLNGASLDGASLDGASLNRASLNRASLNGASLNGASLNGASLDGASLNRASLNGANLEDANLNGANLNGASLNGASLDLASLRPIRADLFDVLLRARAELPALLAALRAGRVNGSTYTGDCACLAGTIANARGVKYRTLGFVDSNRPAERWFLAINEGDTPATNSIAKITEGWIEEFLALTAPGGAA
jgi:hypothetical protein